MQMQKILLAMWAEDEGVLSFEWTILTVVIVFGIVGGMAAGRDAILDELGDVAEAYLNIDQSYSFVGIPGIFADSEYVDIQAVFTDCQRGGPFGPFPIDDGANGA